MRKACVGMLVAVFVMCSMVCVPSARAELPDFPNPVIKVMFTPLIYISELPKGLVQIAQGWCCTKGSLFKRGVAAANNAASRPEYALEQTGRGILNLVTVWNSKNYLLDGAVEDAPLADAAEKYPFWNYGKWGAALGFGMGWAWGPMVGEWTVAENLAIATGVGFVGGAVLGEGVNYLAR